MKKTSLPALVDENGDYCEDTLCYSIEECVDCGPFVPAKVLEQCRNLGFAYVCLIIPNAKFNIMIEVDGHHLHRETDESGSC